MGSQNPSTNNTLEGPQGLGLKRAENLQVKAAKGRLPQEKKIGDPSTKALVEQALRAGFRPQVRPSGG